MQPRSQVTRQALLQAAQHAFAEAGYTSASVSEICAAAGVSKGAFYHHFPSKQALFLELLAGWLDGIDDSLEAARRETHDLPQGLLRMAERARQVFQTADGGLPMFLEFWNQARLDPAVWEATIEPYHRYQRYFAALLGEGMAQGSLKPGDPQAAARVIVALAVGLLLQSVLDPRGEDWGQVAVQSVRILLDGLAR